MQMNNYFHVSLLKIEINIRIKSIVPRKKFSFDKLIKEEDNFSKKIARIYKHNLFYVSPKFCKHFFERRRNIEIKIKYFYYDETDLKFYLSNGFFQLKPEIK